MAAEDLTTEAGLPVERSYGPDDLDAGHPSGSARPANSRSPAATTRVGTATGCGRSGSTRVSGPPSGPTSATSSCSKEGGTGLSVAADLPTQIGYDSDDPDVEEEVGRVGVALDSLADAEILFRDIPLDQISTSWTVNGTAAIMLAFYVAVGDKQGMPRDQLRGTVQNDILKEYVAARHVDLAAHAVDPPDRRLDRVLRRRGAALQRGLRRRRALP